MSAQKPYLEKKLRRIPVHKEEFRRGVFEEIIKSFAFKHSRTEEEVMGLLLRDRELCVLVPESFRRIEQLPSESNLGPIEEKDLALPPLREFQEKVEKSDLDDSFWDLL